MLVYAKTDESDVGNIKAGKPVTFKVDAFPKETFHGVVSQVRMNPTTIQNVVTYDTIIEFANPGPQAVPGNDGLRDHSGGDRRERAEASEHRLAVQAADVARGDRRLYASMGSTGGAPGPERRRRHGAPRRRTGDRRNADAAARAEGDVAVVWKLGPDNTMEPVKSLSGSPTMRLRRSTGSSERQPEGGRRAHHPLRH